MSTPLASKPIAIAPRPVAIAPRPVAIAPKPSAIIAPKPTAEKPTALAPKKPTAAPTAEKKRVESEKKRVEEEQPLKFWAIKKSALLKSPAIFTCVEDCKSYAVAKAKKKNGDNGDDAPVVEYREFQNIWDAVQYIMPWKKPLPVPAVDNPRTWVYNMPHQYPTRPPPPPPPPQRAAAPPPPPMPIAPRTPKTATTTTKIPNASQKPPPLAPAPPVPIAPRTPKIATTTETTTTKIPNDSRKQPPPTQPAATQGGNAAPAAATAKPTPKKTNAPSKDPPGSKNDSPAKNNNNNNPPRTAAWHHSKPTANNAPPNTNAPARAVPPATTNNNNNNNPPRNGASNNYSQPMGLGKEAADIVANLKRNNLLPAGNNIAMAYPTMGGYMPPGYPYHMMPMMAAPPPPMMAAAPPRATMVPAATPMAAAQLAVVPPLGNTTNQPTPKEKPKKAKPKPADPNKVSWEDRYKRLVEYKEKHGSTNIQKCYTDNNDTGFIRWVQYERGRLRKVEQLRADNKPVSEKDAEYVKKLEELGFVSTIDRSSIGTGNTNGNSKQWGAKRNETWESNFKMLQEYKEQHDGSVKVKKPAHNNGKNDNFYRWVGYQAVAIRDYQKDPEKSCYSQERIDRLVSLGVKPAAEPLNQPTVRDVDWDEMYTQLVAFKETHGTVEVPHRRKAGVNTMPHWSNMLRKWTVKMRDEFELLQKGKKSLLTPERMEKLTKLGFRFETNRRMNFDHRAAEWLAYKLKHGKDPPQQEGSCLALWVAKTRRKYWQLQEDGIESSLTEEQINRLKSWGFNFERKLKFSVLPKRKKSWEDRFQDLLEFKEKEGHCNVPQSDKELGTWVHAQRREYRKLKKGMKGILTKEKIEKLVKVGFQWITRKSPTRPQNAEKDKEVHDFREYEKHMDTPFNQENTAVANNNNKSNSKKRSRVEMDSDDDSGSEEEDDGPLNYGREAGGNQYEQAKHAKTPWDRYRLL
ncbi:helicase [Seminavis robusta]|uniref:Helicase n=1 Tax=Seminavis robusta TaxID=568900 RepID=A0A9N8HLD1_9STRA|nr:helicase [Seminavis robusta]|eukprot:Sro674_g185340.1 helicase (969) ;mRNA; r:7119-10232